MTFLSFVYRQYSTVPIPTQSFTGQTIIITGANLGLGLEATKIFVRLHASHVILACWSLERGQSALAEIERETGVKGVCGFWELDLDLEVWESNAGLGKGSWQWSEKAQMEISIAVNVVGTFLLGILMIPVLKKSAEKYGIMPHISAVSSDLYLDAKLVERKEPSIFTALAKGTREVSDRYPTTKLLEVLIVRVLATRLPLAPLATNDTNTIKPNNNNDTTTPPLATDKNKIIINTLHPGFSHTLLTREITWIKNMVFGVFKAIFARKADVAARTLVWAALAGRESPGCYMSEGLVVGDGGGERGGGVGVGGNVGLKGEREEGRWAKGSAERSAWVVSVDGKELQERVWAELMDILEGIAPGIGRGAGVI